MGQYYYTVNLDKKEYLHPHRFGDGIKLMEFGSSGGSTMLGLAILLADGNGRGLGDLRSENPIIGSWAGDRIVIAGDYADDGKFVDTASGNLYRVASESFKDVSDSVIMALLDDTYTRQDIFGRWLGRYGDPAYFKQHLPQCFARFQEWQKTKEGQAIATKVKAGEAGHGPSSLRPDMIIGIGGQ